MSEMHEHKNRTVVSAEGMKKLEEQLKYLQNNRRAEVAEKLRVARGFGDLSENAEYDAAKNEQALLEAEIADLDEAIRTAIVISDDAVSTDRVNVGTTVRVHDEAEDEDDEYTIVGARESDPIHNKISNECPIGTALLGKKVGETAVVEAPDGQIKLKVLEIRRD